MNTAIKYKDLPLPIKAAATDAAMGIGSSGARPQADGSVHVDVDFAGIDAARKHIHDNGGLVYPNRGTIPVDYQAYNKSVTALETFMRDKGINKLTVELSMEDPAQGSVILLAINDMLGG